MRASLPAVAAVLAAALLAPASAYNYTVSCAPPGEPGTTLKTGDRAYVCLTFNGKTRTVFTPTVDSYSAIQITRSSEVVPQGAGLVQEYMGWQSDLRNSTFNCSVATPLNYYVAFDVSSYDVTTNVPKIYKKLTFDVCGTGDMTAADTVPIYTVIIQLVKGVVSGITWDEGCFFCADNGEDCIYNGLDSVLSLPIPDAGQRSCRETKDKCYTTSSSSANDTAPAPSPSPSASPSPGASAANATVTSNPCDLKVYVVWTGTDYNGAYLTSAGRRFSRYRQFGTASLYQGALNIVNDGFNLAEQAISIAQTIPSRVVPGFSDSEERRRLAGGEGELQALEEELLAGYDPAAAAVEPDEVFTM